MKSSRIVFDTVPLILVWFWWFSIFIKSYSNFDPPYIILKLEWVITGEKSVLNAHLRISKTTVLQKNSMTLRKVKGSMKNSSRKIYGSKNKFRGRKVDMLSNINQHTTNSPSEVLQKLLPIPRMIWFFGAWSKGTGIWKKNWRSWESSRRSKLDQLERLSVLSNGKTGIVAVQKNVTTKSTCSYWEWDLHSFDLILMMMSKLRINKIFCMISCLKSGNCPFITRSLIKRHFFGIDGLICQEQCSQEKTTKSFAQWAL